MADSSFSDFSGLVQSRLFALFPNIAAAVQRKAGVIPPGANNYFPNNPTTQPAPSPTGNPSGGFNGATGGFTFGGNYVTPGANPDRYDQGFRGNVSSFATGGMVGDTGPIRPGQAIPPDQGQGAQAPQMPGMPQGQQAPQDPNQIQSQLQQAIQANPQKVASVKAAIKGLLDSGNMTEQELSTIVQLAKVALHNPSSWPQLRAYAIKEGIAQENEIPQEYDAGLVYTIILAGMSMQDSQPGSQQTPDNMPQRPTGLMPSMAKGGMPGKSKNADGSIMAKLHEHEYVIPKHAVIYHGKKHLDKLVEQATYPNGKPQEKKSGG